MTYDVAVYVLWNGSTSFYVGMTRNYKRRLNQHQIGKGSAVTRAWKAAKQPCLPYWKISIAPEFADDTSELALFENLVQETLQRQNPNYTVLGGACLAEA